MQTDIEIAVCYCSHS